MPSKIVFDLIEQVKQIDHKLREHLEQSGGIKTQLAFNTWLTGVILVALLAQFIKSIFVK